MAEIINPGNHNQQSLNVCNDNSPLQGDMNQDPTPKYCEDEGEANLNRTASRPDLGWLEDISKEKKGLGRGKNCDPMQTGQIIQDIENPDRNHVYRYSKAIRGCDEAIRDLFSGMVVIDENGKAKPVPIIWGTQERAVAVILQHNVRKDNSLVTDRIKVPMLALSQSTPPQINRDKYIYHQAINYLNYFRDDGKPGFTIDEKYERDTVFGVARGIPVTIGYTLYAWTLYVEDMNQIVEQFMLKFSPVAYISVRGVGLESIVKHESTANNQETEPGEKKRVIKYQFNLTAETYIPQPIVRKKAVLKTRIDIFNSTDPVEINQVLGRIETAVEELQ